MSTQKRWQEAQRAEGEYWNYLTAQDEGIRRVLEDNRIIASRVEAWLPALPDAALEIGVGGLGVGALGFLKSIPERIGLDPLPPPLPACSDSLRGLIDFLRDSVQLVTAHGECTPFRDGHFGLVLCCNVLDHVCDPQAVIDEVCRILRPGGYFYLDVDVFSLAGLAKWHLWTRHRRRDEILVRAHPQRFREGHLLRYLTRAGFHLVKKNRVSLRKSIFGHSWDCMLLAQKDVASRALPLASRSAKPKQNGNP